MTDTRMQENEKSPVLAALLSIFPGLGLVYIGNMMKALAYWAIFACLIVLQIKARGAHEHVIFALMMGGFYMFQIFDSFNEAKKTHYRSTVGPRAEAPIEATLFPGITILVIGVVFQLASLDIIDYREVTRMWPIVLIALGGKFIYSYVQEDKTKQVEGNNE